MKIAILFLTLFSFSAHAEKTLSALKIAEIMGYDCKDNLKEAIKMIENRDHEIHMLQMKLKIAEDKLVIEKLK